MLPSLRLKNQLMPASSVEIHERLHTLPNNAHQEEEGKDHEYE